MTIESIKQLCGKGSLRWTDHIVERLFARGILMDDVVYSLLHGDIIEEYPNDYPHPSCLVLGLNPAGKALHIVCGISEDTLWLITAYNPNPAEWSVDFRTRKERTP